MADFTNEIKKRRTFAIISHPDAGKTTLTEKVSVIWWGNQSGRSVKERQQRNMRFQTGWRLKKKEVFR